MLQYIKHDTNEYKCIYLQFSFKSIFVFCDQQRDGTLSAGRSPYINYSGMLQQFVQAYISKQQAKDKPPFLKHSVQISFSLFFTFSLYHLVASPSEFCPVERGTVWRGSDSAGALCYTERPLTFPSGLGVSTKLLPTCSRKFRLK